jgi:hypothetical protein
VRREREVRQKKEGKEERIILIGTNLGLLRAGIAQSV